MGLEPFCLFYNFLMQMFYAKFYQKAIDLIGTIRNMFKGHHNNLKFLNALMSR